MNDKEIEKIQTLDVNVSAESMDAHVLCLRENGYKVIIVPTEFIIDKNT